MIRNDEPLEPGARVPAEVERLRAEWLSASPYLRVALTIYMIAGAVGGFGGAYLLTSTYSNWFTWSVTLLILDPVAATAASALVFFYFPQSGIGRFLQKAIGRVKIAMLLLFAVFLGAVGIAIVYFAIEFWKLR